MTATNHTSRCTVEVEDRGSITVEIVRPENPFAVLTLGHGAGSTLDQSFLKQLSAELSTNGMATVRFNFLYSEQRKKMPDRFPAASAVIQAVMRFASQNFAGTPLFAGGKSFGGRMSSMTLAEGNACSVKGIVFYGFPLHPAGNPSVERAEHLQKVGVPLLFIQGTKDALAFPQLLRPIAKSLPQATLFEIEGADHSFQGGGQSGSPRALAQATIDWATKFL